MGLFKFKKASIKRPADKSFTIASIERDVIQNVAICMNNLKITSTPFLKFLNDDGIFEGVYQSHMNDPQVEIIRRVYGDNMYLILLGSHALGAGVYVTLCQSKYKKTVKEFTAQDLIEIRDAFNETDPYELALKTLGYALDGNNKKCLDQIISVGMKTYRNSAASKAFNKEYLKSYMQVMYNAGVTVVLRE